MISSIVTRASAAVLLLGGLGLLFAPEALLALLRTDAAPHVEWLAQLVAAGWLAVAALNWMQRTAILGGIYGRPVVYTSFVLYLVSATSMVGRLRGANATGAVWILASVFSVFALAYGALMLRGPFDPLPGSADRSAP
jgi:hypothetical protein